LPQSNAVRSWDGCNDPICHCRIAVSTYLPLVRGSRFAQRVIPLGLDAIQ
jgi:hypothetical protein